MSDKVDMTKVGICSYIFVSVVTITLLIYFLVKCENKTTDNFSVCSQAGVGGRRKVCQGNMSQAYKHGIGFYSDFSKLQKENGGPKWERPQPGDMNYPESVGCKNSNSM